MRSGSTEGAVAGLWRALAHRPEIGGRRYPPVTLVVLAGLGALLLLVVATTAWRIGTDEQAYWQAAHRLAAGQPLYDPSAAPNTPFAYWYPPPLAQVLAPFTSFVSADAFTIGWTIVLLACLWWLAGRDVLVALALIAFLPVAVELRTRNVHLILAVLIVLALRRSWIFWVPAAAIKIAPALGALYLLAAGRVRAAIGVGLLGAAVLAIVAGRMGGRRGEVLIVVAVTVANPTLWATALSLLVAIVPLLRSEPGVRGQAARVTSTAAIAEA